MNHGIEENVLQSIRNILAGNCQNIDKICLFGSRATGQFTKTSDIDLVLYGDISEQQTDRLYTCFHESMIPYKVDVTAYQHVTYPPLKRHIDDVVKLLFSREQIYGKPA